MVLKDSVLFWRLAYFAYRVSPKLRDSPTSEIFSFFSTPYNVRNNIHVVTSGLSPIVVIDS